MTEIEWRRVQAGAYHAEVARCRFSIERYDKSTRPWFWMGRHSKGSAGGRARTLAEAKAIVKRQLAEWRKRYGAV